MAKETRSVGRPKISSTKKKSAKIFINMSEREKKILEKKAEKLDESLSKICLKALREYGLFDK